MKISMILRAAVLALCVSMLFACGFGEEAPSVAPAEIDGAVEAGEPAGDIAPSETADACLSGLIIGINPGHQIKTISKKYPMAPGSKKTGYGVKTGACGAWTGVPEYETNLQVGLKLARRLEDLGATVVITRTENDVMLTNIDRAEMLNDAGVDVALQLHCDSVDDRSVEGCTTYYRDNGDWADENRLLAQALTDGISAETGCVNRGARVNNNYMSLNWSTTPAVLVEMGFISNQKEDKLLASDEYRDLVADGIVRALRAYFERDE